MSVKKRVRIVKKGEKPQKQAAIRKNSARETARDMVQNVTSWVTEFKQRRHSETATALKLLSETPPATGA